MSIVHVVSVSGGKDSAVTLLQKANNMDQYREFCVLRDYRKPGAEVCQHTEAEAFAMATSEGVTRELAVLAARHERVLDGLILMAEEFAAARRPGKGGHALHNFAATVRGLKANPNEIKQLPGAQNEHY